MTQPDADEYFLVKAENYFIEANLPAKFYEVMQKAVATRRSWTSTCEKWLKWLSVLFIGTILVHRCAGLDLLHTSGSLYDERDKVELLNYTNIQEHIYDSPRAYLVEFFASWCGHCINFAPLWKELAEEVSGWSRVVTVAGIDCSKDENIPMCRNYEIMRYPTIRFFPPGSKKEDEPGHLTLGNDFEKTEEIETLKYNVVLYLHKSLPQLIPNSSLYESLQITPGAVFDGEKSRRAEYNLKTEFLCIVFENEKSHFGKELSLELTAVPNIAVVVFNSKNSAYEALSLEQWPVLVLLKGHDLIKVLTIKDDVNAKSMKAVVGNIIGYPNEIVKEKNYTDRTEKKELPPNVKTPFVAEDFAKIPHVSEDILSMEDLLHAIRNALVNEVGLLNEISGTKLEDLKLFLEVLVKLFPSDSQNFSSFLLKLETWVSSQSQVQSYEYLDKLSELEVELEPWDFDPSRWIGCAPSKPGLRGYTCGLWRLFHTLTISGLIREENVPVLKAMYGFVRSFFGCSDCRSHFIGMVHKDQATSIEDIRNQTLWLWDAHNKVNLRLQGQPTEDPAYPKQTYPNKKQCPNCYRFPRSAMLDVENVIEYLKSIYSRPLRELEISGKDISITDGTKVSQASRSMFSLADYGIFFLVYGIICTLILLVFLHFKLARRRFDPTIILRRFMC